MRRNATGGDSSGSGGSDTGGGKAGNLGRGGEVATGGATALGGASSTTTAGEGGLDASGGASGTLAGNGGHVDGGRGGQGNGGDPAGTAGEGGSSGTAGEHDGGPSIDPDCTCTLSREREFSCKTSKVEVPGSFAEPETCHFISGTRVTRLLCASGLRYTFESVSMGRMLEVDANGNPTYFAAWGAYVSGCGLDEAEFNGGTLEMGVPNGEKCEYDCTACDSGSPRCATCETNNAWPGAWQPLDAYCAHSYCPSTVADARAHYTESCDSYYGPGEMRTGCGKIVVAKSWEPPESVAYTFDEQTGVLEGVFREEDDYFGPCNSSEYNAGAPLHGCAEITTCALCDPNEQGSAGSAGGGSDGVCP